MDSLPPWAREQQSEGLHCMIPSENTGKELVASCSDLHSMWGGAAGDELCPAKARVCQSTLTGSGTPWGLELSYIHTGQQLLRLLERKIPPFMQNISSWELRTLNFWVVNRSLKGCCCSCQYLYDREIWFFSSSFWFEMKYLKFLLFGAAVLRGSKVWVQVVTPKRQQNCQCQIFLCPSNQHQ